MGAFGSRGGLFLHAPLKRSECKNASTTVQVPIIDRHTGEAPQAIDSPKKDCRKKGTGRPG